jgi:serine/threonine protein kinase
VLSGVNPEYVAPEYLRDEIGESAIDGRADVYSLGLLLYYALSSRSPYAPTTGAGWLKAHMTEAPLALESVAKTAPKELCALIMRCLSKQVTERPTAQELSEQLEQLANAPRGDRSRRVCALERRRGERRARGVGAALTPHRPDVPSRKVHPLLVRRADTLDERRGALLGHDVVVLEGHRQCRALDVAQRTGRPRA